MLLIDSEKHTEERVVSAITAVVPGSDEAHASNCFHTARSLGMVRAGQSGRGAWRGGGVGWLAALS